MKVYYAHPMVEYGTRREREELNIIRRKAPDAEVINPARYSGDPGKTHEHMEFYHGLVDECDVVVYSDVEGEFISAGVGEEVGYALEKGKPVYRIDHNTRRLVRVYGEAKHLSRTGTRLLYRTMKWSGFRVEDIGKMVQMKIAEFGGRLSKEDALLMVAADLGVNTKTLLNNTSKGAPEKIKAKKSEKPSYKDVETLKRLYEKEKLSTTKVAELLGVSHVTIWSWLRKYGIEVRSISEAHEVYPKIPFSNNPEEKAYMLGLCAGDIHARSPPFEGSNVIVCSTASAHRGEIKLVRDVWGKYGHCHEYPVFNKKTNQYEFYVYALVDGESFYFLKRKPTEVPKGDLFYPFLAGYADGEANWTIAGPDDYIQTCFRLKTTDPELLKQVKEGLREKGFHPRFRLVRKAESVDKRGVRSTKDYYGVFLERRNEAAELAEKLLPYSRHEEKITWMKLILEIKGEKYWGNVKDRVITLREKNERETKEREKEAEETYKAKHGGKNWFEVHGHQKSNDEATSHAIK